MNRSLSIKGPETLPKSYAVLLDNLKNQVRAAQAKAGFSVNRELIRLYWTIGQSIVERQKLKGWGKSVVEHLAKDLHRAFPKMSGFSPRNVWRMRSFFIAYTEQVKKLPRPVAEMDGVNLPRPMADIPWGHNAEILDRLKNPMDRLWYAKQTLKFGWSRNVLTHHIQTKLIQRQGKASLGLLLCKTNKKVTVEYALRNIKNPIGVAQWETRLVESLPVNLRKTLPSTIEVERGMAGKI